MVSYFSALGHPCPKFSNPAEHVLDLVSIDYSTEESETTSRARVHKLLEAHRAKLPTLLASIQKHRVAASASSLLLEETNHNGLVVKQLRRPGALEQFKLLFKRSWRQITRSKGANIARAASNIFSAVVFGALFFQMGTSPTHLFSHLFIQPLIHRITGRQRPKQHPRPHGPPPSRRHQRRHVLPHQNHHWYVSQSVGFLLSPLFHFQFHPLTHPPTSSTRPQSSSKNG